MEAKTRYLYPHLSYYKKGDDAMEYLKDAKNNVPQALRDWADALEGDAKTLRTIAALAEGRQLDMEGGANCLDLSTTDTGLVEALLKAEVASIDEGLEETIAEDESDDGDDESEDGSDPADTDEGD